MESLSLGNDPDEREWNELVSLFDAPAYVRRGRTVEESFLQMLRTCRKQREEWLEIPRLRVGQMLALAGSWQVLQPMLADETQIEILTRLHAHLQPKLRLPPAPTTSPRALRSALQELVGSIQRFNLRWRVYLEKLDLAPVNELRLGYNRYYILEKSCALRSDRLARVGFVPLNPLDVAELLLHLPLLVEPRLRS